MATREFNGGRSSPELVDPIPLGQPFVQDFPVLSIGSWLDAFDENWSWYAKYRFRLVKKRIWRRFKFQRG
jgi:hypothetical protein